MEDGGIMSRKTLVFMMLCNFIPLLHILSSIGIFLISPETIICKIFYTLTYFYIFPPIVVRILFYLCPIKEWKIRPESRDYYVWWLSFNLQVIFSRFPFTEEVLRIIPTLYSNWLRLWGSKIGKFTYWSPMVVISDRSMLKIGDNVVVGAGARLVSHALLKDKKQNTLLLLKEITIGNNVILGGYSVIAPGVNIAPNISTRAFFIAQPFTLIDKSSISEDF